MFDVIPVTSSRPMDCGPTCLKMLLAYYGQDISLDDLTRECGVNITGCSARALNKAGRAHGLDMIAFQMDADELVKQDRPAIIWWRYSHWCVMCGMDSNGNIVICNPDRGRYGIDPGSFAVLYSGVALFNGDPEDLPEETTEEA